LEFNLDVVAEKTMANAEVGDWSFNLYVVMEKAWYGNDRRTAAKPDKANSNRERLGICGYDFCGSGNLPRQMQKSRV
jgi:hypothetical protein